jgi:hypothetical protein
LFRSRSGFFILVVHTGAERVSTTQQLATLEEAGGTLLAFALDPHNWVSRGGHRALPAYLRVVNGVQICAAVDLTADLDSFLRISFRGTDLSPMKAADLLEAFVKEHFPFTANSEWEVEIDGRRWIHFSRRYTSHCLHA